MAGTPSPTLFKVLQHALNVGVVDKDKLHRVDLERMRLAAEQQTNWVCDTVGRMFLRPGSTYIATSPGKSRLVRFIAAQSASYILEFSDSAMRVMFEDELLTRPAVISSISSGDFSASSGWTLATAAGQTSTISGDLILHARAHGATASAKQQVSTDTPGVEHALRIVVSRGPVGFRVGSTDGADDLVTLTSLDTGTHSIAFTPSGAYWVQFESTLQRDVIVDSIAVEGAGVVSLPTIWPESALKLIRHAQSLDVMYVGAYGYRPQKIERRGEGLSAGHSWSVVDYKTDDGPFLASPTSTAKLTPSALEGNITITSDKPFFKSGHVGALIRMYHDTQAVDTYLAGDAEFTPTIQVTGINETSINERFFVYSIAGTWSGTLRNQRSFDGEDIGFHDYRDKQSSTNVDITSNQTSNTNDDDDDNAITWYRIGFPAGKYTSGEAHVTISYNGGGGFGIARITSVTDSQTVSAEVLTPFKADGPTSDWLEGAWSDIQGWPIAPALFEGRLSWVGSDKFWASVSDAYQSMDIDDTNDDGPIDRAIALGGRNEGRWVVPVSELIIGTDARIARAGASSLDEIITPSNLTIRSVGKIGAAALDPAELRGDSIIFAETSGYALYSIDFVVAKNSYLVSEFSKLSNELFLSGIEEIVVQDRPDQRIHICTTSGDAITIVHEPEQNVTSFVPISTSVDTDQIISQCVVPGSGTTQDRLYREVKRVVNGATVYFIEKVALDSEAVPGDICKVMDAGVAFGAGSATITGLDHLEGRTVVAWADGAPVLDASITDPTQRSAKQFTVSGGSITLPSAPTIGGFVGIPYTARYKSARLAYGVGNSSPVLEKMALQSIGLLLHDYVRSGLRYGAEFDNADHPLQSLPTIGPEGVAADEVVSGVAPDEYPLPMASRFDLDSRLCLETVSPYPCSVGALVLGIARTG